MKPVGLVIKNHNDKYCTTVLNKANIMSEKKDYLVCGIDGLNGLAALIGHALAKRKSIPSLTLEDIESVREMLRVFQPERVEYEYFDAIIQMHRGYISQAIQTLEHLLQARPNYPSAKVFLAYALFLQRDASWETIAAQIVEDPASKIEEVRFALTIQKKNAMQKGLLSPQEYEKYMKELVAAKDISSTHQANTPMHAENTVSAMPSYGMRM